MPEATIKDYFNILSERSQSGENLTKPGLTDNGDANDQWDYVDRNYGRCASLGHIFNLSQRPIVTDVEVIVCFADIRGFTTYCRSLQERSLDNRVQNFLRDYTKIYPLSILETIWRIDRAHTDEHLLDDEAKVRDLIVPTTYKNLGDGMMLVWELPSNCDELIQGRVTHRVLETVFHMYRRFSWNFQQPGLVEIDAFGEGVQKLRIGFGVARGHAWKLDFGRHLPVDYAGSVINLAARLQDQARPEGIMCEYDYSRSFFELFAKLGKGRKKIFTKLHGLSASPAYYLRCNDIDDVWKSGDVFEILAARVRKANSSKQASDKSKKERSTSVQKAEESSAARAGMGRAKGVGGSAKGIGNPQREE